MQFVNFWRPQSNKPCSYVCFFSWNNIGNKIKTWNGGCGCGNQSPLKHTGPQVKTRRLKKHLAYRLTGSFSLQLQRLPVHKMLQQWPSNTAILGKRLTASCQYYSIDTGTTKANRLGMLIWRKKQCIYHRDSRLNQLLPRLLGLTEKRREVTGWGVTFKCSLRREIAAPGEGFVV